MTFAQIMEILEEFYTFQHMHMFKAKTVFRYAINFIYFEFDPYLYRHGISNEMNFNRFFHNIYN